MVDYDCVYLVSVFLFFMCLCYVFFCSTCVFFVYLLLMFFIISFVIFSDCHLVILLLLFAFFFFKHRTAYDWRISDWSSDVCSSDLPPGVPPRNSAVSLPMCQAFKVVAGIESGPGAFQWPLGASSAKPRPGRLLSTRSYSLTTTPDPYWGNEFEWTTTTRLPSPSAAVTTDVPPPQIGRAHV